MVYLRSIMDSHPHYSIGLALLMLLLFSLFNLALKKRTKILPYILLLNIMPVVSLGSANNAQIIGLGKYINTHKRHFIQQCEYTICRKLVKDDYIYYNHEEAF